MKAPHFLAEEEVQVRVPITIFGGFITEKSGPNRNEINLKTICRHIIKKLPGNNKLSGSVFLKKP